MSKELRRVSRLTIGLYSFLKGVVWILLIPYHLLSRSGVLYFLIPPSTKVGVITFDMPTGPQPRIIIGRKIVGKYNYDKRKWLIQHPYRLFFDERKCLVPPVA